MLGLSGTFMGTIKSESSGQYERIARVNKNQEIRNNAFYPATNVQNAEFKNLSNIINGLTVCGKEYNLNSLETFLSRR
jgi:hypothetical protein